MAERPSNTCFSSTGKLGKIAFLSQPIRDFRPTIFSTTWLLKAFIQRNSIANFYQWTNQFHAKKLWSGVFEPCGMKISAVCSFVSSQSMRVTDGWIDGRTYRQADRIMISKTTLALLDRDVKTKDGSGRWSPQQGPGGKDPLKSKLFKTE